MGDRGLHLCTWPPSLSILTCEVAPVAMLTLGAVAGVPAGLAMELLKAAALWCLGFRGLRVRELKEAWRQVLPVPLLA